MFFIRKIVALVGMMLVSFVANAAINAPENGKEFTVLANVQATPADKKIEVIEFFAYTCPHCYALDPLLENWIKKQGNAITFKRVHVSDQRAIPPLKLFLTLETMGKADELQSKIFNAVHVERVRLFSDAAVLEFIARTGVDKQKFSDIYNSFTIQTKLNRAAQQMEAYKINSWPTLIIDGRFVTSPSMAAVSLGRTTEEGQNQALLPVLDWLVARAQKEKKN